MNWRVKATWVAVMLMALCASGLAEEMLDLSALDDLEEAQTLEEPLAQKEWTYPIPYELLKASDYLVLVNRDNLLGENDIPEDLVDDLTCRKISYDPIRLRETAANALQVMFDAAQEEGIYLYAHSGYRSYQTQNTMYYNRLKSNNGVDDGVVQYPGASEHQSGLAIDIINKAGIGKKFTSAFGTTKEGLWVAEHCWDYGFIIRYPENSESITGYMYEPWHIRYVGEEPAKAIMSEGITLEEYLGVA